MSVLGITLKEEFTQKKSARTVRGVETVLQKERKMETGTIGKKIIQVEVGGTGA